MTPERLQQIRDDDKTYTTPMGVALDRRELLAEIDRLRKLISQLEIEQIKTKWGV